MKQKPSKDEREHPAKKETAKGRPAPATRPGKEERERAEARQREADWKAEGAERTDLRRRKQG